MLAVDTKLMALFSDPLFRCVFRALTKRETGDMCRQYGDIIERIKSGEATVDEVVQLVEKVTSKLGMKEEGRAVVDTVVKLYNVSREIGFRGDEKIGDVIRRTIIAFAAMNVNMREEDIAKIEEYVSELVRVIDTAVKIENGEVYVDSDIVLSSNLDDNTKRAILAMPLMSSVMKSI